MKRGKVDAREMKTRNISIPKELDALVQEYVAMGMFGNYSEVIRHAVRLMQAQEHERQLRLELLRRELGAQGLGTGTSRFDINNILQGGE